MEIAQNEYFTITSMVVVTISLLSYFIIPDIKKKVN